MEANCFSCEELLDDDQLIELDKTPLHDAALICESCYDEGITSREMYMMLNYKGGS